MNRIELLTMRITEDNVSKALGAIASNVRTGKIGDSKIFVLPVAGAMRVRTGDLNENAI